MRILFVAMSESIHVAKWLALYGDSNDELFLYPSNMSEVHKSIDTKRVKYLRPDPFLYGLCKPFGSKAYRKAKSLMRLLYKAFGSPDRARALARTIRNIAPDLIHSMETQHAGYLVLECKERFFRNRQFPLWFQTNWGSDIYLFGRLEGHRDRVLKIMAQCNYYSCESRRDIELGKVYGYCGPHFDPFPNACGFDIAKIESLRNKVHPRDRKTILVKGYQGWSGRALFALSALAMVAERLSGYEILVFSAANNEDVKIAAQLLHLDHGINFRILGDGIPHQLMLEYFAAARIYLGLNISDGISTSLLEAMAMGAFPIQSNTSTASEWIIDGESGFIVPPEDPSTIARKLETALADDALVDSAAAQNWEVISARADSTKIKERITMMYDVIKDAVRLVERKR